MEQKKSARVCPECGSGDYRFRGRKNIPPENGKPEAMETKYRCQACGHEWRERVGMKEESSNG
jgi:rubredoxin